MFYKGEILDDEKLYKWRSLWGKDAALIGVEKITILK